MDQKKKVPMYIQIKNYFIEKIESGAIKEVEMLPSERMVSEYFHVSRMTARNAIQELVQEGYAVRRGTRGTFANRNRLKPHAFILNEQSNLLDPHIDQNLKIEVLLAETIACPKWLGQKMNIAVGTLCFHLTRRRSEHNEAKILDETYVNGSAIHGLEQYDFNKISLHDALEQSHNPVPVRNELVMEQWIFDEYSCETMGVKQGTAGIRVRCRHLDKNDNLLILSRALYRGDTVCMTSGYTSGGYPLVNYF